MGSTSETYENGTNVVVYVTNENAHIDSQHQQQYHSHTIVSGHLPTSDDNVKNIYNVCPKYGPSAITVTNFESNSLEPVTKSSSLFNFSQHQNDSDSCTINGDSMRDNTNFASYNGDDREKLLITNNTCFVSSKSKIETAPPVPLVSASLDDSSASNFVSACETSYARSESVRSVDSVASASSSLSSSSVGNSKIVPTTESFAANINVNVNKETPFTQHKILPETNKDFSSPNFQKPNVSVPVGWKRLPDNGSIIYISPSNCVLSSLAQVNSYLLTDGNCFCGLDCPLYAHTVFNFDPEVVTSPVPATPGAFAKLCNHKRKHISQNNGASVASLPIQSYENIPLQSNSVASPFINNYCNPGAVVKKHAFDISDRRKKRKLTAGQMYANDDASVPSPNVMVHNDCDISAKENNPSVITTGSQVENPIYYQQLGMAVGMPEPHLSPSMGSSVRLKSPFNQNFSNQNGYYNSNKESQNYGYNVPMNDCYSMDMHFNHNIPNQSNMYMSQEEFHMNQNNTGYNCNQNKNSVQSQQTMNQHHHVNCNNVIQQQHHMACNENIRTPHMQMNNASQTQQLHIQMGAAQHQHNQYSHQQQDQQMQKHHAMNQQTNFQHKVPNHNHHHQGYLQQGNASHHSVNMNSLVDSSQMMNKQMQNNFIVPDGSAKNIYVQGHDNERSYESNMNSTCGMRGPNSICNCYHNNHTHQSQSSMQQSQNSCMADCTNDCHSALVQNGQDQQMMMQQGHHIVTHDNSTGIHQQVLQPQNNQRHSAVQNVQMQTPGQVYYQQHIHHSQQQLQMQKQQLHQQQQYQQQMHLTQNQNVANMDTKIGQRCDQMMPVQGNHLDTESTQQYVNHMAAQRNQMMWQQKNMQHISVASNSSDIPVTPSPPNPYERVPPLHPHVPPISTSPNWSDGLNHKKLIKSSSKSPPNISAKKMKMSYQNYQDGRSISNQNTNTSLTTTMNTTIAVKDKQEYSTNVPSFMEDPSGYLAQQTALLNSTISKQTGENPPLKEHSSNFMQIRSPVVPSSISSNQMIKNDGRTNILKVDESKSRLPQAKTPDSSMQSDSQFGNNSQHKLSQSTNNTFVYKNQTRELQKSNHQFEENPVTSSTYSDRERNISASPTESRSPIQAGTVSTSHQSPIQPGMSSPNVCGTPNPTNDTLPQSPAVRSVRENDSPVTSVVDSPKSSGQSAVTAIVSGPNYSNNTITSVVAGKTNTAIVSINNSNQNLSLNTVTYGNDSKSGNSSGENSRPASRPASTPTLPVVSMGSHLQHIEPQFTTKSPLEMVQNVVSSIQIPSQNICNDTKTSISSNSIQASHFLVSNNGQLLVATSNNVGQQNLTKVNSPISMMSNSSVVTNVTGTMTQVIPTVGVTQQVLGQPTVLVNTLPSGQLVFQPSVMALDSAGNAVQIPQLTVATNNVVSSQTVADAGTISVAANGSFSPRGQAQLLSPETAKRKISNKKRKLSPQQMLQISSAQSSITSNNVNGAATSSNGTSVVVQPQTQQNFSQSTPMLQTLILPNKNNQFASTQPLIATANMLQPVNLVHNIPTIQQFIVPAGLGGMVMTNADGTATLLPETVQLNVLTPVQNAGSTVFGHATSQGILTASPTTGMVIRAQPSNNTTATVNAQLRSQTISGPGGTQFIATQSPNQFIVNNTGHFNGQLSPIVANMSPGQHIHAFNTSPNGTLSRASTATAPEYIQCVNSSVNGQTLMVPCSVSQPNTNPQNTTVVQQNTTIVQQQMTMVSNNQQLPETTSQNSHHTSNINLGQHNIILNDAKHPQNFFITTADKANTQSPTGYILSPKNAGADKQGTHIILNNLNSEKQSQSFIISSSPSSDKQLCGNFILTNTTEKSNARGNFIIAGSQTQNIERTTRFSKHSVSTQTAAAAAANSQQVLQISSTPTLIVATNNTFSQTGSSYSGSHPDTTTHSPIGNSGHSPSSSIMVGSTDDIASPTSSTPIGTDLQRQPMVHCISSSSVVDWTDNVIEDKKVNIVVDGSSELITGLDMCPSLASMQSHLPRRSRNGTQPTT